MTHLRRQFRILPTAAGRPRLSRRQMGLVVVLLTALTPVASDAQNVPLDSLLAAHSYPLTVSDRGLEGPGGELVLDASADAQFVMVAEEHNVAELAAFCEALFDALNEHHAFEYAALEQGSVITSWMGAPPVRGSRDAVHDLVRRYPTAATFATDQELDMIARIGLSSDASVNPVWGVDQEFGALHIFDRLAELAPSPDARRAVTELADEARRIELDRTGDTLYIAQVLDPVRLAELAPLFSDASEEARELVAAVTRSNRIYRNMVRASRSRPTRYESVSEREESMKRRFMERYREAVTSGDPMPRVLAKLGHWHILRGMNRANVVTFGTFLSELAAANGAGSLVISTYVFDGPETWRNSSSRLVDAATDAPFTLIDLRPLRPFVQQQLVGEISDGLRALFFQADMALLIRGGRTGTYRTAYGD